MSDDIENIQTILSEMGYSKNEDGKFLIDLPTDDFGEDEWDKIFRRSNIDFGESEKYMYPVHAFKLLLKEKAETYPCQLASHIFYNVLKNHYSYEEQERILKEISKIEALLRKIVIIRYSIEDFLKKEVKVNIGVDTGDSDWDYTANTVPPGYGADHILRESSYCASISWLTKQQGHRECELHYALKHIQYESELVKNPLMFSIAYEVWHEMSIFNQLFFLVKMTIKDVLQLNTLLQWHEVTKKWGGYIIINKEATAGFYDSENGGTSLLGIHLEKDVKLPIKFMSCAFPDKVFHNPIYSIAEDPDLWDAGKILYWNLPKHFRLNMESLGLSPVRKNIKPDTIFE